MTFPKASLERYVLRVGKGCVLNQQVWMLAAVHYWKGFPGGDIWPALCKGFECQGSDFSG